jgi:DNA invertase Pin-like site-specific DNA recombinase
MKVVIYSRVSTDKQSHESQLFELREYCQRRGWEGVEEISDTISGAKADRKGLDRLMGLVRRGKVDAVVCFKLDRLGRSLGHLAQLIAEFDAHRVALIAPGQGLDTSTSNPAGKLQMHVLMAVAEFEKDVIRERINAGLAAARARGAKLGRPRAKSRYHDDVLRLRAEGLSVRAIAARLKIAPNTVFKIVAGSRTDDPVIAI